MIPIGIFLYSAYRLFKVNLIAIENTKAYILETVSPIFNRKGYSGTSLSDLTKATNLTKGALYGNFKNKEELGVEAFKFNLRKVISSLAAEIENVNRADEKLYTLTRFYRKYYEFTKKFGGCPIVNVGVDTHHTNPVLFAIVKKASIKLEKSIEEIIRNGVEKKELWNGLDPEKEARNLYSMIEGGIFMAAMHNNRNYINDIMDLIDDRISELYLS